MINMKKIGVFLSLPILMTACGAHAGEPPAIGLWEKFPVSEQSTKLVARPQYIFTDRKLSEKTRFTGLREVGTGLSVLCCVVVTNTTSLNLSDIVKKYAMDPDFVAQMKSIKGLNFIYEAEPVEAAQRNAYFQTVLNTDKNPDDLSPFSAPVIGASVGEQKKIKPDFQVGADNFHMKTTYLSDKNSVRYEFKVNGKSLSFSENSPEH